MVAFPSLPSAAINYIDATYEDPAIRVEFEYGYEAVRSRRQLGRYAFTVAIRLNDTDVDTLFNFLIARRLSVEAFNFTHPKLGTLLVRFDDDELPRKVLIDGGSNGRWYDVSLKLKKVY